jgi:hypothetical protein
MEHEIHDHAKKAYKTWKNPKASLWHKVKEIAMEVAIIVFAVSVSIWFHNMSETRHKRHDVKEFMLGLKEDLTADIAEMESDRASYYFKKDAFTYLINIKMKEEVSKDSLKKYGNTFGSSVQLLPNSSLFEGFKSSGKLGDIENHTLQNDILDLYQDDIATLLSSTHVHVRMQDKLADFVIKNRKRLTDSTDNFLQLAKYDEARNIFSTMANTEQITERYTTCIDKMKKIIIEINKEYGLK